MITSNELLKLLREQKRGKKNTKKGFDAAIYNLGVGTLNQKKHKKN